MIEYEFSEHAFEMMKERQIREIWVKLTLEDPHTKEPKDDGTVHYIRAIDEHEGRCLRVIVNPEVEPQRIVTLFFDRRLKKV